MITNKFKWRRPQKLRWPWKWRQPQKWRRPQNQRQPWKWTGPKQLKMTSEMKTHPIFSYKQNTICNDLACLLCNYQKFREDKTFYLLFEYCSMKEKWSQIWFYRLGQFSRSWIILKSCLVFLVLVYQRLKAYNKFWLHQTKKWRQPQEWRGPKIQCFYNYYRPS